METSNATGTTGFSPIDPSTVTGSGAGGTTNYRGAVVQLQYVRSDGFLAAGVEINGVRAYDSNLGAWTTPDAYEGDVHDPASQQRYMWNHGNAVDYSDPSGYTWDPSLRDQPISGLLNYMRAKSSLFNNIYNVLGASRQMFSITTDKVPMLDGEEKGGLFIPPGKIVLTPFGPRSNLEGMVERLAHEIGHAYDSVLGGNISWILAVANGAVAPIDNREDRAAAREWFADEIRLAIMSELRDNGYSPAQYRYQHDFDAFSEWREYGRRNPQGDF